MLDKKQKEVVCTLYDIELSKLPKLKDCVLGLNDDEIHVLSKDDKKALLSERNKIMKLYRNMISNSPKRCEDVEKFIEEPKNKLALAADYDDKTLESSLFVSNVYVGYFMSKFSTYRNENIIVKVTVQVLGKNLYNIKDEVIFVEDFDINRLREEMNFSKQDTDMKLKREFIERLWNDFRYSVEYFNHDYPNIDDLENHKALLQTKYKIDADFSKLTLDDDYTWENIGYEVYDNRLVKNGKVKTLRSQVKKM